MGEQVEVRWSRTARRSLQRIPEKVATAAIEFIYGPLSDNPQRVGTPLRFELAGLHSARRGDYRIIYGISDAILIVDIEHRADVYR